MYTSISVFSFQLDNIESVFAFCQPAYGLYFIHKDRSAFNCSTVVYMFFCCVLFQLVAVFVKYSNLQAKYYSFIELNMQCMLQFTRFRAIERRLAFMRQQNGRSMRYVVIHASVKTPKILFCCQLLVLVNVRAYSGSM